MTATAVPGAIAGTVNSAGADFFLTAYTANGAGALVNTVFVTDNGTATQNGGAIVTRLTLGGSAGLLTGSRSGGTALLNGGFVANGSVTYKSYAALLGTQVTGGITASFGGQAYVDAGIVSGSMTAAPGGIIGHEGYHGVHTGTLSDSPTGGADDFGSGYAPSLVRAYHALVLTGDRLTGTLAECGAVAATVTDGTRPSINGGPVVVVPEPAALSILAGAGLLAFRRRRR